MNRVKLIVNPNANLGRAVAGEAGLRSVAAELGGGDWVGTVYPRHAVELAQQAAEQGYELVVAVGGDGTVHEVINGLMRVPRPVRPRLGVVPFGSGNDFAHAIGMPDGAVPALRQVYTGRPQRVDLGRLTILDDAGAPRLTEYFDNTLGIGFDAAVVIRSRRMTWLRGMLVYLAAVLQTIALDHVAPRLQVRTDSESWDQASLMLVLCNGPREGGGFFIQPQARLDDGLLHYAGVGRISRLRMLRLLPEVLQGTHGRFREVRMGAFERLELDSSLALTIHADGEILAGPANGGEPGQPAPLPDVRRLVVEALRGEIEVIR